MFINYPLTGTHMLTYQKIYIRNNFLHNVPTKISFTPLENKSPMYRMIQNDVHKCINHMQGYKK